METATSDTERELEEARRELAYLRARLETVTRERRAQRPEHDDPPAVDWLFRGLAVAAVLLLLLLVVSVALAVF